MRPHFVSQLSSHHTTPNRCWTGSEVGRNRKLAFMNLVRELNSENDSTGIVEALQADHRLQAELHLSVVLLHDVVEILTGPNLDWVGTSKIELAIHSHDSQCRMAGFVAIQRDAVRMRVMFQGLAEERLCRRLAPRSTEIELHGVALPIHGAVQIHQLATNLNKGFVDAPAATHWPLEASPALLARFGVANDPSQNRRMRNDQPTFTQDFDQIPITELEAKVPAKAEKDDFVFEPTTSEEWIPFGFAMCHALIFDEFPSAICTRTESS